MHGGAITEANGCVGDVCGFHDEALKKMRWKIEGAPKGEAPKKRCDLCDGLNCKESLLHRQALRQSFFICCA
jgi:hypothetical protein